MSALMNRISDTGTVKVAVTMGACIAFGVLAVWVALWDNGTVARGLLWAGAWSAVGWFLGFLFGIPRFLSTDTARTPEGPAMEAAKQQLSTAVTAAKNARDAATAAKAALSEAERMATERAQESKDKALKAEIAASQADTAVVDARRNLDEVGAKSTGSRGASLTVNTNLEQISDWLTKIIVGVSLVESQALLLRMRGVATFMARSMIGAGQRMPESAVLVASKADAPASAASAIAAAAKAVSAVDCYEPCGTAMIAPPLQAFHSMESVAYAVMLYFLATGLLGSYLLTRLYLQRVLDEAANQNGA